MAKKKQSKLSKLKKQLKLRSLKNNAKNLKKALKNLGKLLKFDALTTLKAAAKSRSAKALAILALGYGLHIAAVEGVEYKLYSEFGDCVLNDGMPPVICQLIVASNINKFESAILYMPNLGYKALNARAEKYFKEHGLN